MKASDIKSGKFNKNLATKRRQVRHIRVTAIGIGILGALGALGYLFFFAPWLKVTNVTFKGVSPDHQGDIQGVIDQALGKHILGLPVGKDILFLRAGTLEADLAAQFSYIKDVSIQKKYFHTIVVSADERQAQGVWCFQADCRYFDQNGVTFGQAIESSGVLLLNVDDMRDITASTSFAMVDQNFLKGIQTASAGLTEQGIKIKSITIPEGSFTEFDVNTADGYPLKFSLDSQLQSQLEVFRIFRQQKLNSDFHPIYIDLRFDGRVYFK